MAYLTFRYGAVIPLVFTAVNSYFIRNTSNTKDVLIPYTNGNGQVLTAGQVLYTTGTVGTEGYLQVESKINQTLTSSGDLQTVVYHYPISTQANYVLNFNFEGAPISIGMYYNSAPVTGDVILEKYNRVIHTFAVSDFVFSDYDGDEVTELAIFGDVTGYEYSGVPYVAGTWISMFNINAGSLKYNPVDQDTYYEKVNQYKVKDSEGNISLGSMGMITLKYSALSMADPNPIYVGSAMGYGGGNTSGFSDTKWNATDESTAIQTEFGYNKIVGFQIFLNKTVGEMMSIANAHSQHDSGVNQTYPIFLDETNKHLVKKVRIINPTFGNTQFPVSEGVVYNNDAGTRRKAAFVVIGNSFSGSMGNEVTDITVPALVNEDVFGSVYVGCTRIDSSRNKAQIKENVLLQLLDASGNPIEMYQPLSSDPQTVFRLIGYELVFGSI